MRGDDQPSRYPPRGVWFGLILSAGLAGLLLGQDAPDPSGPSTPTDSRGVLGPARVALGWRRRVLPLPQGESAVLQGVNGIRSRGRRSHCPAPLRW